MHSPIAAELGPYLYRRTEGNPLFLVTSLNALIQQGVVGQEGGQWVVYGDLATLAATVPEDLQHLITQQLEALDAEDQQILAVASVSGETFSTAEVAVGCQQELEAVEARCEQLACVIHCGGGVGRVARWDPHATVRNLGLDRLRPA